MNSFHSRNVLSRGVTLLDTLVGVFLMLVIFLGIASAFELSVDVVTNNKARAGAIALANERMEYMRSLAYSAVGTSGGIPSGTIAQSEIVSLNGINYTRRTFIEYEDDPKDGTGASDTNSIVEDYKSVKVDVAWTSRNGTRHITLATRVTPPTGLESAVPGGTLTINAVNAIGGALLGARVQIINASTSPAINITTFTDASGTVSILGAPSASNYQIVVNQNGYSTAQTYGTTAQNTNPSPANLSVTNNHTTNATFAIDVLGSKSVNTWTQILSGTWTDAFSDNSKVATSSNIGVTGGKAQLSGSAPFSSPGEVQSIAIAPSYLAKWKTLSWVDTKPSGTATTYRVYDGAGQNLIPDGQLPGNSAGFTSGTINLAGISTTTYQSIRLDAVLTTASTSATPSVDSWSVAYDYGPQPLPSIAFAMRGNKTIGTGPSGTLYKYSMNASTNGSGTFSTSSLEWDTYLITINGASTGYDIASSCAGPQPESLSPGASQTTNLFLAAHTSNSLLVDVRSTATGVLIPNATVVLGRTGFTATSTTDGCGQAFFSGITSAATYIATTSAATYQTSTVKNISVTGQTALSVTLN